MSSQKRPFSLNTVLVGVNVLMLVLIIAGVMVYINVKHRRAKSEMITQPAQIVAQLVSEAKAQGDDGSANEPSDDEVFEELPRREEARGKNNDAELDELSEHEQFADRSDLADRGERIPEAEIEEKEMQIARAESEDQEGGLLEELSVKYSDNEPVIQEPERAKLILLQTEDIKMVDELAGIDQEEQDRKHEAAEQAMDDAGIADYRRPNYRKVRSGLIDVAQALVRLNSRLSESEPGPNGADEEAITQLDYDEE
ncbi:hypothetical protein [Poriferisphaera sp. WC338]|uniref:hypothetical protein n=1 Tax=Poriferisphaera sp. WC338 TaxID=3425129 RepID=UPI003D8129F6